MTEDEKNVKILKSIIVPGQNDSSSSPSLFDQSNLKSMSENLKNMKKTHSELLDQMSSFALSNDSANREELDQIAKSLTQFKMNSLLIFELLQKKQRKMDSIQKVILNGKENQNPENNVFKSELKNSLLHPGDVVTNSNGNNLNNSDNEENDFRKYVVDKDFYAENEKAKSSFIKARFGFDEDKSGFQSMTFEKENVDMRNSFRASVTSTPSMHPQIEELIKNNNAFLEYPVNDILPGRKSLPTMRDPAKKVNAWSILKENIGKDLSKMTMPVYCKEPITLLQKMSEFLEYRTLLKKANNTDDPFLRIAYISGFFLMWISQNQYRLAASFNSLLAETYEFVEDDLKIVFESVSTHPQIAACYGESNDYRISSCFSIKTNFSFKGFLEIETLGDFEIYLKKTKENFKVKRPKITIHNFVFGELYMWLKGSIIVTNMENDYVSVINFKPKGWSAKHDYEIEGHIQDENGEIVYTTSGKWISHMIIKHVENNQEIEVARKYPDPENCKFQYGFNTFSINCNHKTVDMLYKFPPTESRMRPDVQAYEYGNFEMAAFEKNRLEENQRKRRKLKINQEAYWFKLEVGEKTIKTTYKGGYFEARESGKWPKGLADLFND